MASQTISLVTPTPTVEIKRVGGNLRIEGWDRQELEATGEVLDLSRESEGVAVSAAGETAIKLPRRAELRVGFVGGKLEVRGIQGTIEIGFVGGDLELHDLNGQITLRGFVGGGTRLENVAHFDGVTRGPTPFGSEEAATWGNFDKILEKAEEKRRHVEKKVRQAEKKLERMRVGIERDGRRWKWGVPTRPGQEAAEGANAASDGERMTILRMLQEKKITAAEAEQLLTALEGQA